MLNSTWSWNRPLRNPIWDLLPVWSWSINSYSLLVNSTNSANYALMVFVRFSNLFMKMVFRTVKNFSKVQAYHSDCTSLIYQASYPVKEVNQIDSAWFVLDKSILAVCDYPFFFSLFTNWMFYNSQVLNSFWLVCNSLGPPHPCYFKAG